MFATLLMEEARTQARRNAGVVGIIGAVAAGAMLMSLLEFPVLSSMLLVGAFVALVAMPAVVSVQAGIEYWTSMYGARGYLTMSLPVRGRSVFAAKALYAVIAVLASAAVATLLGIGWLASYAYLLGTTLEQFLEPVRQMISMVGTGGDEHWSAGTLESAWFRGARSRLHCPLRGQPDCGPGRHDAAPAVVRCDQRADRRTHDAPAVHRGRPRGTGTASGGNRFRSGGTDHGRGLGLVGGARD